MNIYCCGCEAKVDARLTDGEEIYPHRSDLFSFPFWRCDACNNYVGCHHKTKNRTAPLGCIPTPEIKKVRIQIHALIDPIWREGKANRKEIYAEISEKIGRKYHSANIRTIVDAQEVYRIAKALSEQYRSAA